MASLKDTISLFGADTLACLEVTLSMSQIAGPAGRAVVFTSGKDDALNTVAE